MSYDQFCHNCGLNFQRLSAEEEARYAQDPGYCPNCGYPLAGNYPPPTPLAPPVWNGQSNAMPPARSTRRRNVLITVGSLLLVIVGLFVLLTSCAVIDPGQLLGAKPSPTMTTLNGGSSTGSVNGTTIASGGTQAITGTQTAIAGGGGGSGGSGGNGGGGAGGGNGGSGPTATPGSGSGGGGGPSPTATLSGGGGGNPTATPTPAPPVVVTVSPTSIAVQCGNTTTIVMTNPSSTQTANWTASAIAVPAYILSTLQGSATHGTIPPHGSQTITVSNIKALAGTVIITSGGLPQTVTITCTLL